MTTLILNTAARGLSHFVGAAKIRAKIVEGTVFLRPTNRKTPVNLPKGEKLVDLASGKLNIEGLEANAGAYGLQPERYGWFVMTPDAPGRGPRVMVA